MQARVELPDAVIDRVATMMGQDVSALKEDVSTALAELWRRTDILGSGLSASTLETRNMHDGTVLLEQGQQRLAQYLGQLFQRVQEDAHKWGQLVSTVEENRRWIQTEMTKEHHKKNEEVAQLRRDLEALALEVRTTNKNWKEEAVAEMRKVTGELERLKRGLESSMAERKETEEKLKEEVKEERKEISKWRATEERQQKEQEVVASELMRIKDALSLSGQEMKVLKGECQREFDVLQEALKSRMPQGDEHAALTTMRNEMSAIQDMKEETKALLTQMEKEMDAMLDMKSELRQHNETGQPAVTGTTDGITAVMASQDRMMDMLDHIESRLTDMEGRTDTEELADKVESLVDVMRRCRERLDDLDEAKERTREEERTSTGRMTTGRQTEVEPGRRSRGSMNDGYFRRLGTVLEDDEE